MTADESHTACRRTARIGLRGRRSAVRVGCAESDRVRFAGGPSLSGTAAGALTQEQNLQQLLSHRAAGWRVGIDEPFTTEQQTEQRGRQARQQAKWPCGSSCSVYL